MAVESPPEWEQFERVNVSLDALTGASGLEAAAGAFGADDGSAVASRAGAGLFVRGHEGGLGESSRAARDVFTKLGGARSSATRHGRVRLASIQRSALGSHVTLQQHLDGVDVLGATAKVHLSRSGDYAVTGAPIGDLESRRPVGEPSADVPNAVAAAADALDVDPGAASDAKLVIFPLSDGSGVWAYQMDFTLDDPVADVRAYVRDGDAALLLSLNMGAALRGRASVFPVNPTRTPDLRDVSLAGLGEPIGSLIGTRVVVAAGRPPGLSRVDRDFRIGPDEAGFDEASVYHHVWSGVRYFARLHGRRAFPRPPFRPIRAIARDPKSPGNAFYLPKRAELSFGDIDGRPTARSADIVYHELGHAVSDAIARLQQWPRHSEPRGLAEGYSDYFATSALDDPRIGDYVKPSAARDSSRKDIRFQADFSGLEHQTGAVWAALLWAVRERLGARVTDRVAYESLFYLTKVSTFAAAATALETAHSRLVQEGQADAGGSTVIREEWDRRQA